jgi:tetratricopeptide (TPR) repeat protein
MHPFFVRKMLCEALILCSPINTLSMTKYFQLSLLMLFSVQSLIAQDSLVRYHDLHFRSPFEKNAFDRFTRRDIDAFALLMANGNLLTDAKINEYSMVFENHIASLKQDVSGKKPERQVKTVHDNLHKRFLGKYEMKNRFEEVFYNGQYNCVSATAIYALAFDRMNIPYAIKEEPTHVYLVAYPQQERIVLETTSATAGYMVMNPSFKLGFVKALKAQKVITGSEVDLDVNTLFDKYYFGNRMDIDVVKLAGIQYLNEALGRVEEKDFKDAFTLLEKAYYLYPSPRIAYTLLVSGLMAFEGHQAKDSVHAILLSKISRYTDFNITEENIVGEFGRVTHELLLEDGKTEAYDRYFKVLKNHIDNQKLLNELSFFYYYENARAHYNRGRYTESLPYIEKAIAIKPQHLDAQSMLLWAVSLTVEDQRDDQSSEKVLEGYATRFPELLKNNHFIRIYTTTYLTSFSRNYLSGKITDGERYRLMFEKLSDQYPEVRLDQDRVGAAYSNAAVYYFKKGQVSKARALIDSGLKYAPRSYELYQRKQMLH